MVRKGENIYKRKDGRWEGRYIKGRKKNGSIHYGYVYGKKYSSVRDRLNRLRQFSDNEIDSYQYTGTFLEWADHWLNHDVLNRLKLGTYTSYKSKLDAHLIPIFGDKKLVEISSIDIQSACDLLSDRLSVSSLHAVIRVLRTCLNGAIDHGLLTKNPADKVVLPKMQKRKIRILSMEEHSKIKQIAKRDPKGLPIILTLETGLRLGEVCGLKWENVDLVKQTLDVTCTLQRLSDENGQSIVVEGTPKTINSYRTVPLSDNLTELLTEKKEKDKSLYVFGSGKNAPEPRVLRYHLKEILRRAQLPDVTFHSLRHAFATRCLELGVNITTISALLGHGSIKMTLDIYTHSFLKEERAAVKQVAEI